VKYLRAPCVRLCIGIWFFLGICTVLRAQDQSACEITNGNKWTPTTPWATLDSDVTLVVSDLDACLKEGKEGHHVSDLRVFLDGRMLSSLKPTPSPSGQNYLKFRLHIDMADRSQWADIINDVRRSHGPVTFTLADVRTGQPFVSQQVITLDIYPKKTPFVIAGLVVLLLALIVLGSRSNLLRDNPTDEPATSGRRPISLGRAQMAWWFYLVVAAFLYLWLITGQSDTPTGSVLALIGISGATGFAGAVVDRQKNSDVTNKRADLGVQQTVLEARIEDIESAHPPDGSDLTRELLAKKDQLNEVKARIAVTPAIEPTLSKGLLKDLFCDGDGVSFYRFQIIVWTIVLGVVFVHSVHRDLAMPDFDATLLGLMGLSSGTYIGFKFPEKAK
jgi:hypothetical protein